MSKEDFCWSMIRFLGLVLGFLAVFQLLPIYDLITEYNNLPFDKWNENNNVTLVNNWSLDFWPAFRKLLFFSVFAWYMLFEGKAVFAIMTKAVNS